MTAREPPPRRAPGRGREFGHHCPPTSERRTRLPGPGEAFSSPTPQHLPKPVVRNLEEGRPQSPSRGSSGGFPPPEPQPQRDSQGAGRLVSAGDPLGRGRHSCHLAPFKAQKAIPVPCLWVPWAAHVVLKLGDHQDIQPRTLHLSETLERPASEESRRSGTRVGRAAQGLLWMTAHTQQQWDAWTGRRRHSRA